MATEAKEAVEAQRRAVVAQVKATMKAQLFERGVGLPVAIARTATEAACMQALPASMPEGMDRWVRTIKAGYDAWGLDLTASTEGHAADVASEEFFNAMFAAGLVLLDNVATGAEAATEAAMRVCELKHLPYADGVRPACKALYMRNYEYLWHCWPERISEVMQADLKRDGVEFPDGRMEWPQAIRNELEHHALALADEIDRAVGWALEEAVKQAAGVPRAVH